MPTPTPTPVPPPSVWRTAQCVQISRRDHLADGVVDGQGVTRLREGFVWLWSGYAHPAACLNASSGTVVTPRRGDVHPDMPGLYVSSVGPVTAINRDPSRRAFEGVVEYSNEGGTIQGSPLSLPPDIKWDFSDDAMAPYRYDFDPDGSKLVQTSSHEPLAELQRPQGTTMVSYSINLTPSAVPLDKIIRYTNYCPDDVTSESFPVMNSDSFTIDGVSIAQYQARFRGANVSGVQVSDGIQYRTVTYLLAIRHSWLDRVLDYGYKALNANGTPVDIGDLSVDPGQPAKGNVSPWPLDGTGHKKPKQTDAPATLTFYPLPALPFAVFNLR